MARAGESTVARQMLVWQLVVVLTLVQFKIFGEKD